jgi:hypothetical protein
MGPDVEAAVATILAVDDPDERALLLERIDASLRPSAAAQGRAQSAWRSEIESRVDEILTGKVELVDAEETYRLLSAELADLPE